MTYSQAYKHARLLCAHLDAQELSFDLSCLMKQCFGIERYALPLIGDNEAPEKQRQAFFQLVEKYASGIPLQYLLGEWEFYGLRLKVGPGVLIPRPDTETLVDTALKLLRGLTAPRVADLCAGSGCITAAIAQHCPEARLFALERSEEAFVYLQQNLSILAPDATALLCDVFTPPPLLKTLDFVLSNPPYLDAAEMDSLSPLVAHEPGMALFGGTDGLDFYRRLPALYFPLLRPGGYILFEVGYTQAEKVSLLLLDSGYKDVTVTNDLAGVPRVVSGKKPL